MWSDLLGWKAWGECIDGNIVRVSDVLVSDDHSQIFYVYVNLKAIQIWKVWYILYWDNVLNEKIMYGNSYR